MKNSDVLQTEIREESLFASRRKFLKSVILGGSALLVLGNARLLGFVPDANGTIKAIIIDYSKCTGCRTCETVCAAANNKIVVDGKEIPGLGNPFYANIKVSGFNPDIDIPLVCAFCPDAPCVASCPVEPDAETGRKALYRHKITSAVTCDKSRCITCGTCSETCRNERTGIITPHPETGNPMGMCTLCDGDPQCVKYCPFGALAFAEVNVNREFFGKSAGYIAGELNKRWYALNREEVPHGN